MNDVRILQGDALEQLRTLPDESVNCCVSSPPYWGLRDYGVEGQIGLEKSPEEYVSKIVTAFREVRRVLRNDGTCWVNLGDSYAGGGNYRGINSENTLASKQASNRGARGLSQQLGAAGKDTGLEPKNLVGIPWRVAFALQADGWYLRSDIIWHKPNPMPESVTDRPTKSHEYIFLLSRKASYFYDADAIKEPLATEPHAPGNRMHPAKISGPNDRNGHSQWETSMDKVWGANGSRNKRSVWTVPSSAYSEAHFATFPPDLIKPCILAGCPVAGTVLDPFAGSGTVGLVATELARNSILIELNPSYVQMIRERTFVTHGLPF